MGKANERLLSLKKSECEPCIIVVAELFSFLLLLQNVDCKEHESIFRAYLFR